MSKSDSVKQSLNFFVQKIIYKNADTGYAVLSGVLESNEAIFVVGELIGVDAGQWLIVEGRFLDHKLYGRQFCVESFKQTMPSDEFAIRLFLSSGAIKGIGPVLGDRIVNEFKAQTLKILETTPQELLKIKGVTQAFLEKIKPGMEQVFALKRLLIFLESFKLKSVYGVRAWKKFGVFALEKIRNNPFVLTHDGIDLPFFEADVVAKQLSFSASSVERIESAIQFVLKHNAFENGHTCAPHQGVISIASGVLKLSVEVVEEAASQMIEAGRLFCVEFRQKQFLFLPVYFFAEQFIAQRILKLMELDCDKAPQELVANLINLKQKQLGFELVEKQKVAIEQAVSSGVFVLTGGPGTGKTTILKFVISILEQLGLKVAICAPTGRAVKRLSELTDRAATTIHRLLGVCVNSLGESGEFVHTQGNLLEHDVVVVDEMSMVDCLLFCGLLKALKPNCRLILTGDFNQLPSISAGNVFKNLIESEAVAKVELTEIFRQAAKSLIVKNAHAIVSGGLPDLQRTDGNFFFLHEKKPSDVAELVVELATVRLVKAYAYNPLVDLQVICLFKKGLTGTININKMLQSRLNKKKKGQAEFQFGFYLYREGDKVMQIKNDYEIEWEAGNAKGAGIFNGDIGFIKQIDKSSQIFTVDFDGKVATYRLSQASEIELAYAITVHRSQGQEFRCVVLPVVARPTEFFSRNLLYTAVTRAKENLVLVGSESGVEFMCRQVKVNYRYSGLKHFLTSRGEV